MGPWLANNIRECDGLAHIMAYWDLSDVFEEQGVVKTPFYGGYGLLAERGIPKAAFRAFELLHRLGTERVVIPSENALVTRRNDGAFVVALWNYAEPGEPGANLTFTLQLKGLKAANYQIQSVAPGNASPVETWKQMGSPRFPTRDQIRQLQRAAELSPAKTSDVSQPIVLAPQTLALIEITP